MGALARAVGRLSGPSVTWRVNDAMVAANTVRGDALARLTLDGIAPDSLTAV
jgi:hypothetical protein